MGCRVGRHSLGRSGVLLYTSPKHTVEDGRDGCPKNTVGGGGDGCPYGSRVEWDALPSSRVVSHPRLHLPHVVSVPTPSPPLPLPTHTYVVSAYHSRVVGVRTAPVRETKTPKPRTTRVLPKDLSSVPSNRSIVSRLDRPTRPRTLCHHPTAGRFTGSLTDIDLVPGSRHPETSKREEWTTTAPTQTYRTNSAHNP